MARTKQAILIRVTQSNEYNLTPGSVYELINGEAPPELARISEPFTGRSGQVRELDVQKFAAHNERELRPRPAPTPSGTVTYPDVLSRAGWDDERFSVARGLNFPLVVGRRLERGQPVACFLKRDVDRWFENLGTLVRVTNLK